jgi:hypothetical protein
MEANPKLKETLRLLAELEELLPDFLEAISVTPPSTPEAEKRIYQKRLDVRAKMNHIIDRAKALQWATDCMPAAEAGRKQPN